MLYSVDQIIGSTVLAAEGDCGIVRDILFDDSTWIVRYLVVKAGEGSRGFLLPFDHIYGIDTDRRIARFSRASDGRQLRTPLDKHPPVSRQHQLALRQQVSSPDHDYDFAWDPFYDLPANYLILGNRERSRSGAAETVPNGSFDPHLRSSREVIGYRVEALHGRVGRIQDILLDTGVRSVRFFVISWRHLWRHLRMKLAVAEVRDISWPLMRVSIGMEKAAVRSLAGRTAD
jgi:uncharacterized protein YrrD